MAFQQERAFSRLSRGNDPRLGDGDDYLLVDMQDGRRLRARQDSPSVSKAYEHGKLSSSRPGLFKQWHFELISCIMMLGMLAAIIAILRPNEGRPLPQLPYHISLNTLIAVLTTILKASALVVLAQGISHLKWDWFADGRPLHDLVIFDAASRGPWGCLQLIFNGRGGHLIASLGALLVVLSLGIDAFTQQVVRYYDCQRVSTTAKASLARSTSYDEASAHTSAGMWPPATILLGYIDQGLYNPSTQEMPFVCETGNCTFTQSFSTLGFCATCKDLSDQLVIKNVTLSQEYINGTTNETESVPQIWLNTTLPSGTFASIGSTTTTEIWFSANYTDGWTEIVQASQPYPYGVNSNQYIAKMRNTENSGCNTTYDNATWACQGDGGSGAAACKFNPCVRTYQARVEGGKLYEEVTNIFEDMFVTNLNTPVWVAADVKCAGETVMTRLADAGFTVNNDTTLIPWNVLVNSSDGTASIWSPTNMPTVSNATVPGPLLNTTSLPLGIIPPECIYEMYYPAQQSITSYLSTYLAGTLNPGPNGVSTDGPSPLRALYNETFASFESINSTFHSIAEGITQRVRQYKANQALPVIEPAEGDVNVTHTCVHVRWAYLIFPIVIVALTTVFLVAVIVVTSRGIVGDMAANWKSSPLPMTFQALTFDSPAVAVASKDGTTTVSRDLTSNSTLHGMKKISKRTTARLNVDGVHFT